MTYLRHAYHIEGVTDLSALVREAEVRARKGGRTMIHVHRAGSVCRLGCRMIQPNGG